MKIWNLETIPLNNEGLSLVNTKFLTKYLRIVAFTLLHYNISIFLKLRHHIKGWLISRFLNFLKNLSRGLKIICLFVKVAWNVYITANKSTPIHTNQILIANKLTDRRPDVTTSLTNQVNNQSLKPSTYVIPLTLTLKMTTTQGVWRREALQWQIKVIVACLNCPLY